MGLFSQLFKPKTEYESEVTIELLNKWEQNHFSNRGYYSYDKSAHYNIYRINRGEQYENTKHDFEMIRIRVEAMSEVAEQYAD